MSQEELHTINCPTCGGPIPPFTGSQTRCPFCGATVERPKPEKPAVQVMVAPISRASAPRAGSSRSCLLVVGLAVLLLVAGVVLFLFIPSKGPAPNLLVGLSRSVQSPAIPVPTDRQGPADVLVLTYDSGSDQRYL